MQKSVRTFILGISPGDKITIITEGRDEVTALNELEAFANNGMTE